MKSFNLLSILLIVPILALSQTIDYPSNLKQNNLHGLNNVFPGSHPRLTFNGFTTTNNYGNSLKDFIENFDFSNDKFKKTTVLAARELKFDFSDGGATSGTVNSNAIILENKILFAIIYVVNCFTIC